jgi:hypothetical protein
MKKKEKEHQEAIKLRGEGRSVKEIARMIGVSPASVSVWVRDVLLTDEQKVVLCNRSPRGMEMKKVWEVCQKNALEKREEWQEEGKKMAHTQGTRFIMGCMLYWAEGSKGRNAVRFSNSDVEMMRFFVCFLREYFDVKVDDITIRLSWYSGNGLTFEDTISYWINNLKIEQSCVRKSQVDAIRRDGHGKKIGKLPYGTCHLCVSKTEIVQKIFGAIQGLMGFRNDKWIE